MENKNKALLLMREQEHQTSELNMKKTAELFGLEKEVHKVNKTSAYWDEILEKLRNETQMLKQEQKNLKQKITKMGNKEMILKKANQSTETEIEGLEAQIGLYFIFLECFGFSDEIQNTQQNPKWEQRDHHSHIIFFILSHFSISKFARFSNYIIFYYIINII